MRFQALQHAACIPDRARCWLMQANEELKAQLRQAQQAQQASDAQAAQLQAAENKVRQKLIWVERLTDALQSYLVYWPQYPLSLGVVCVCRLSISARHDSYLAYV